MGEPTCGLAPRSGATKEYRDGYWDALRTIRKGKVKDPEGKLAERTEKFLDGDQYSGGVAQALADTGIASPLFTSEYKTGNDAYRCLMAGNKAGAKKEEKPASAAAVAEPKAKIPQGKQCSRNYNQHEGLAPVYDLVEICTETFGNILRTTTRTQTYKMTMRNNADDILIGDKTTTFNTTISPPSEPSI